MDASNASLGESAGGSLGAVPIGRVTATIVAVAVTVIVLSLVNFAYPTLDPKEPPLIQSKIPIIGHIIGPERNIAP